MEGKWQFYLRKENWDVQRLWDLTTNPTWSHSTALAVFPPHKWFATLIVYVLIQVYKIVYYSHTWEIYKHFYILETKENHGSVQIQSLFLAIGIVNTVESAETKFHGAKIKCLQGVSL